MHTHPQIFGPRRDVKDLEKLFADWCHGRCPLNYEGLKKSGLTAFFDGFGTARKMLPGGSSVARDWETTVDQTCWRLAEMYKHTDSLIFSYKAEDVRRAKREGKIAMFMHMESTIGGELDRVNYLYGMGFRAMGLTHSFSNSLCGGCNEKNDGGLTHFGENVVRRMNELGMIVDLSHCGKKTCFDAIELSKDPCTYTHNACESVYNANKSVSDEEMKALAEKGGVIGIEFIPNTVASGPKQTIQDGLNHIDYAVKLIGVDHVGIGTDMMYGDHAALHRGFVKYEGMGLRQDIKKEEELAIMERGTPYVYGMEDHDEWPNFTRGLVAGGYSDQEIEKIVGGNILRIMEKVLR